MKLHRHRRHPDRYELAVQLDEAQPPEGDNLVELEWAPEPPGGMTRADYQAMQVREAKLLAEHAVAQRGAGTKLSSEGQAL